MTKAQWKAIYDYCDENGLSKQELLQILKERGIVDRRATLEDLESIQGINPTTV